MEMTQLLKGNIMTCECPALTNQAQLTPNGAIDLAPAATQTPVISPETPVSLLTSATDAATSAVAKVTAFASTVPDMGWIALGLGILAFLLLLTRRGGEVTYIDNRTIRTHRRPQFESKK